jgi:hypothetical protein
MYGNILAPISPKSRMKKGGWVKPLKDFAKINVGALFDVDLLRGRTGAVIHDILGNFITTRNSKLRMFMMQCQWRCTR